MHKLLNFKEFLWKRVLKGLVVSLFTSSRKEAARLGLVSLFNGISTFVGYLMPKSFSEKNSSGTI